MTLISTDTAREHLNKKKEVTDVYKLRQNEMYTE